jgi:hypothetical protein
MKKKMNVFLVLVAMATFGLNLSINSNGEFSFVSDARAQSTETTAPSTGRAPIDVQCQIDGETYGTGVYCMKGDSKDCTIVDCPPPPSTPPPSTPGEDPGEN